jgi:hypothetical protein
MTPIPLSPFITTNNLLKESACPRAETPTVAATSAPNVEAAAVTHSPREVSSAVAPGMARSNSDPLDIPDFLRRVRIKPEGEAAVISNNQKNVERTA